MYLFNIKKRKLIKLINVKLVTVFTNTTAELMLYRSMKKL